MRWAERGQVVLVIFLFPRNVAAAKNPDMALPFSILGTFSIMYLLNFSLNNISMMGVILSMGFVVDDAIVMLENIVRHIEKGEKPFEAALKGSKEHTSELQSHFYSLCPLFLAIN